MKKLDIRGPSVRLVLTFKGYNRLYNKSLKVRSLYYSKWYGALMKKLDIRGPSVGLVLTFK